MAEISDLFRKYYHLVFSVLLQLGADEILAEELTQETFFRAYVNLKQLRSDDAAASWLCSIAKHLYFSHKRSEKTTVPLQETLPSDGPSPALAAERAETVAILRAAAAALKAPYAEVFRLRVLEALSFAQIGEAFGKGEGWARVTYYRAKTKITERIRNDYDL